MNTVLNCKIMKLSFITGVLIFTFTTNVIAADNITGVTFAQDSPTSVVVKWDTPTPSSSAVDCRQDILGQDILPTVEYSTNTLHHQYRVTSLMPGAIYYFQVKSVDGNGTQYASGFNSYALPYSEANTISQSDIPQPQYQTTQNKYYLPSWASTQSTIQSWASALRNDSGTGAPVFGILAAILMIILNIADTIGLPFLVWLTVLPLIRRLFHRTPPHWIDIVDDRTGAPVSRALVQSLDPFGRVVVDERKSDLQGVVDFAWVDNSPVTLRISAPYYQSKTVEVDNPYVSIELSRIDADDDLADKDDKNVVRRKLLSRLQWLSLIIGTILVLLSIYYQPTLIAVITALGYLGLWVILFVRRTKRWHHGQLVDVVTRKPVSFAEVALYRDNKLVQQVVTNKDGMFDIYYPLAEYFLVMDGPYKTAKPVKLAVMNRDYGTIMIPLSARATV